VKRGQGGRVAGAHMCRRVGAFGSVPALQRRALAPAHPPCVAAPAAPAGCAVAPAADAAPSLRPLGWGGPNGERLGGNRGW